MIESGRGNLVLGGKLVVRIGTKGLSAAPPQAGLCYAATPGLE